MWLLCDLIVTHEAFKMSQIVLKFVSIKILTEVYKRDIYTVRTLIDSSNHYLLLSVFKDVAMLTMTIELSACLLTRDPPSYSRVLEKCENALERQPDNIKALYRKGVALYHLERVEQSMEVFEKIEKLSQDSLGRLIATDGLSVLELIAIVLFVES